MISKSFTDVYEEELSRKENKAREGQGGEAEPTIAMTAAGSAAAAAAAAPAAATAKLQAGALGQIKQGIQKHYNSVHEHEISMIEKVWKEDENPKVDVYTLNKLAKGIVTAVRVDYREQKITNNTGGTLYKVCIVGVEVGEWHVHWNGKEAQNPGWKRGKVGKKKKSDNQEIELIKKILGNKWGEEGTA